MSVSSATSLGRSRAARPHLAVALLAWLISGWFVAPALDAWAFHRAANDQQSVAAASATSAAVSQLGTHPPTCAILDAGNLPQGAPTSAQPGLITFAACDEPAVPEIAAPSGRLAHLLPPSRAPPSV